MSVTLVPLSIKHIQHPIRLSRGTIITSSCLFGRASRQSSRSICLPPETRRFHSKEVPQRQNVNRIAGRACSLYYTRRPFSDTRRLWNGSQTPNSKTSGIAPPSSQDSENLETPRAASKEQSSAAPNDAITSSYPSSGFATKSVPSAKSDSSSKITSTIEPRSSTTTTDSNSAASTAVHSHLAIKLQHLTDQILDTLNALSHRLNIYTGTDYTPISDLREAIAAQEDSLRELYTAVDGSKTTHSQASTTQAASQKEVVQLLERKHSWSAQDLERYMSLIRSEHVNEHAVTEAKEQVRDSERQLEEARQGLEKMERRMYHEEQVWSDTIRRNSTWVTFGLMGLNLVLLVGNFVVFEPWRRRRIVREVRDALDEKTATSTTGSVMQLQKDSTAPLLQREAAAQFEPTDPQEHATPQDIQSSTAALAASAPESQTANSVEAPATTPEYSLSPMRTKPSPFSSGTAFISKTSWEALLLRLRVYTIDLFSEQPVLLRKVDITNAIVESILVGAAGAYMLIYILESIARR